ncbi:huazacin family RiPP peptide [Clostridium paraputrificum]|nr:huazacin family RiPP peptide [Clostridium paraputrificum]
MNLMTMASRMPNGWKCIASCLGICLADTASPVLDVAGYAVGLVSANA